VHSFLIFLCASDFVSVSVWARFDFLVWRFNGTALPSGLDALRFHAVFEKKLRYIYASMERVFFKSDTSNTLAVFLLVCSFSPSFSILFSFLFSCMFSWCIVNLAMGRCLLFAFHVEFRGREETRVLLF